MNSPDASPQSVDYGRVEAAIRFLEANFRRQPSLDEITRSVHLSNYHFQRLFTRWAGASPMQFLYFLTLDYAKKRLAESRSILNASFDAGLSGSGRLHDLFVTLEAVTPGQFKSEGAGLEIRYGTHPTLFGSCVLARTPRGICHLSFARDADTGGALTTLKRLWPRAAFADDSDARGVMASYQDIAACLRRPGSVRPVGNAVAANPVAYLIPYHRAITRSGKIHRYRWGTARKKAMLGWEAAHASRQRPVWGYRARMCFRPPTSRSMPSAAVSFWRAP